MCEAFTFDSNVCVLLSNMADVDWEEKDEEFETPVVPKKRRRKSTGGTRAKKKQVPYLVNSRNTSLNSVLQSKASR